MSKRCLPFAILCIIAAFHSNALADAPTYIAGKSGGGDVSITLDSSMAGRTISVYAAAPDGDQSVEVGVAGVGGEIVTVKSYTQLGKQSAVAAASRQTTPLNIIRDDGKAVKQIKIINPDNQGSSSSSSSSQEMDPDCFCMTPDEIEQNLEDYRNAYPDETEQQFCAMSPQNLDCSGSSASSSSSSSELGNGKYTTGASTQFTTFLSYNSCLPAAAPGIVVDIDLTHVSGAALTGKKLFVATKFHGFKGGRQATIKPKSDGRYSPQPLLLTATVEGLYYTGGDTVTMNHWRSKVRTGAQNLKIVATINYNAELLEIPMGRLLTGGKGTFDVTHGAEGYSFCATFSPQRQTWGGYGF